VLREYVRKLFLASYHRFVYPEMFYYLVINLLLGICVGLFLGLEHLIREFRKEGMWEINKPKLILVGLPSLYFSLGNIWFISGHQFVKEIIAYPIYYLLRYVSGYESLFQVIFGYVVITSFLKDKDKFN
jgi:hypothetical protein